MRIEITTETGSIYILDQDRMTWERTKVTPRSGPVRTDSEQLTTWPDKIQFGQSLVLNCPPLVPGTDGRMIVTSPVVAARVLADPTVTPC